MDAMVAASPAWLVETTWPKALPDLPAVYEGALASRPGKLARSKERWEHLMREDGRPAPEIVIATGPHGTTGYATYRIREGAPALVPTGEVAVQEVCGRPGHPRAAVAPPAGPGPAGHPVLRLAWPRPRRHGRGHRQRPARRSSEQAPE